MSLKEKIDNDIREAMKAREKDKLEALRAIKAAILLAETEKGAANELTPDAELKLLQKLLKQRKEAADIYLAQNRQDLANVELYQAQCIERYLPQMMDEDTITVEIKKIMQEQNISDPKDFGKLMGIASRTFAGKADNKMMADVIRKLLG